jgi:MFS transporter, UMF1 family
MRHLEFPMKLRLPGFKKDPDVRGWVLYDWANSAFATTIMAGFFPVYFKLYLSHGVDATVSTARLGVLSAAGVLMVGLIAPLLGAVSDLGGWKKRLLLLFTLLGATGSSALALVTEGSYAAGAVLFALAAAGFSGAVILYDALLPSVAHGRDVDRISAAGYAWGYLGGGILFALNVTMYIRPEWFGLSSPVAAIRVSFISVGAWWVLFSIPLFLFVREPDPKAPGKRPLEQAAEGLKSLLSTFLVLRKHRQAFLFLAAFLLYNDGIGTIIKMAVDYGLAIGLGAADLMKALLLVQFIGFPSAIALGQIGSRWSPKAGIYICLIIYMVVVLAAYRMQYAWQFYALAAMIGLAQGGIQALSRSYFSRLFPPDRSGEFFGFYGLTGKFSGVLGPLLVGWTAVSTGSSRLGILSIAVLFLAGGLLLSQVKGNNPPRMLGRVFAFHN